MDFVNPDKLPAIDMASTSRKNPYERKYTILATIQTSINSDITIVHHCFLNKKTKLAINTAGTNLET
ncbi:MAG: hypothetical protein IKJ98_01660 [Bacteroidales bacterium]|nr:hypothetical protein [Bacteroidales bacterium]